MSGLRLKWTRARGSEDFAWACLVTNLVGVPGVGTLMAGRWEGLPQLALSLVGGVLLTWWLVATFFDLLWEPALPLAGADMRPALWGGGLFAAGWTWALASGMAALRSARAKERVPYYDEPRS